MGPGNPGCGGMGLKKNIECIREARRRAQLADLVALKEVFVIGRRVIS